jgi:hypothetical protein
MRLDPLGRISFPSGYVGVGSLHHLAYCVQESRAIGRFRKSDDAFSGPPNRVDAHSPANHFAGVTAILHRLLTLGLVLALVVSTTAQLVPSSMAQPDIGIRADMAGGCDRPQPPCTGHTPNCVDHLGCLTVPALPTSPASIAVAFEWTSLDYDLAPESLPGISVKPELSPPILAA